jgi:hypothetical protein
MNQEVRDIDYVVTGTPRSGTAYIAQLLSYLGIDCGHEVMFNPWEVRYQTRRSDTRRWGDSSWLAVPFLEMLPPLTKVFHIVRDPVRTINSIIGTGQIDWPTDYRTFLALHCWGDGNHWPTDIATAAEDFWVTWNSRIERSGRVTRRFQVEKIDQVLRALVTDIQPDADVDEHRLEEALKTISTTYNTRPRLTGRVLTSSDLGQECRVMASRYGYSY